MHGNGVFSFEAAGLRFDVTDLPTGFVLETFYEGYDAAFILPQEKESIDGFRRCLTLNRAPDYGPLESRYGVFREVVFVASEATAAASIGGGNFIVLSHAHPSEWSTPAYRTVHLNYIYVRPEQRRKGYFNRLIAMVNTVASQALPFAADAESFVFIEQNDPLKMAAEAYAQDTLQTGLDQVQRIGMWARRGARIVDFDYVQPPLSDDHSVDETLALCVLRPDLSSIGACIVRNHLRAFFGISVLKGGEPYEVPAAYKQLTSLDSACTEKTNFRLFDPRTWVDGPGRQLATDGSRTPMRGGLRAALMGGVV
jgi:GNAT superfamily N-acetyltransferase